MNDIKAPHDDASIYNRQLGKLIQDEILHGSGRIGFDRFMELAMYAPGLGYYSAGAFKFGEAGDFVTAPEISPLFSRCIARQCDQVFKLLQGNGINSRKSCDILEAGAGSGVMACGILAELERLNALPAHYYILDISADLRDRQRTMIKQDIPHLQQYVHWLEKMPEQGFTGVVLANEVLDAMPVHRVQISRNNEQEYFITTDHGSFVWHLDAVRSDILRQRISVIRQMLDNDISEEGYTTEINLAAESWIRNIADFMAHGLVLIIDYGFPRHEYYHPQRNEGTLMCHYRHQAHDNPLVNIGLQDITSHIDFTAIAEAGHDAGLTVSGYTNQGHFLLACGLMEVANIAGSGSYTQTSMAGIKLTQEIKKLTLPHEMGELFKVLALTRDIDSPLLGFSLKDDRGRL